MFKIIKRKVYEDLVKDNKKLSKKLDNKVEYLNCLLEQIDKLNKQINELKSDLKKSNSNNIDLQRQISTLIDTNKKLNDWVNKILNDVGISEIHDRTGVTIPCYIQDDRPYYMDAGHGIEEMHRQEIVIPELRFIKMGGKH